MAAAVEPRRLLLTHSVPEELDGAVEIAFHLPGDAAPIYCHGQIGAVQVGEGEEARSERRAIELGELDEVTRGRIEHYIAERLGQLP